MLKLSLVVFPVCHPQRVSISFPAWVAAPLCCCFSKKSSPLTHISSSLLAHVHSFPPRLLFSFLFFLISCVCVCRCSQLFSSQCASHLSITLSVPADNHLPTDEEETDRDKGKQGRSSTAVDYTCGSGKGHNKIQEDKQLHYHTQRTVCNWHVIKHIFTQMYCFSQETSICLC